MSGQRPLAPSKSQSTSSARFSEQTQSSPDAESTAATSFMLGSSGSGDTGESHKRRRVPGNISQMACTECRQARQKCDGQRPNPCSRCTKRKLTCTYEPHIKTHKTDLIKEIEELREDKNKLQERDREAEKARAGLESRNRDLEENSDMVNIIFETLRQDGHDKEIITRLRAGQSHQDIAEWLIEQVKVQKSIDIATSSLQGLLQVVSGFEKEYQEADGLHRAQSARSNEPEIVWIQVSQSHTLIGHLFDLYFTWVHPIHMLFSELDFKHSFRCNEGHYCSSTLVNAVCAMACHLLENEGSGSGPWMGESKQAVTLREGFLAEARRSMTPDTFYDMTSIQALGVMYLTEVSSGKARRAMGYLRSAVENVKNATPGQSEEAREITMWGINTLNTACVGMTYQKLWSPELPRQVSFDHVQLNKDDTQWRFYRSVGDTAEMPKRPSHAILTAFWQAKLFHTINDSLNMYCGYNGRCTAEKVIRTYKNFTIWKAELPQTLQSIEVESQPLPHVLHLHVQYHTAVMEHLMPLLYCDRFSEADTAELRQMVVYHARRGLEVLSHSRRLYTTRYQMPLLSFCVLHLGDVLIRETSDDQLASEVVVFCLEMLARTRAGFAVCGPLSLLFRRTADQHRISLPPDIDEKVGQLGDYSIDDILDACTRLAYAMPLDQTFRHIDRSIAQEWSSEWARQVETPRSHRRSTSASEKYMQIGSLLND